MITLTTGDITWTEHLTRRGLPFYVPDRLPVLSPAEANRVVRLPLTVNWSDDRSFDLGDSSVRWLAYRKVMTNGAPQDIAGVIHGPYLVAMWPMLRGDRDVLEAWRPLVEAASGFARTA